MQRWGTDAIRDNFHPDFWIFVLERAINAGRFHGTDIGFITDARFLNELEFVRKMNGLTIRIDRMNLGGEKVESNGKSHSSESKWMEWTDWDRVAENVVDSSKSQEYNMERFLLELTRHIDPFVLAS